MCGCEPEHGPYGGSAARQASRAVAFLGCRSSWRDIWISGNVVVEKGKETYRARKYVFQVNRVEGACPNNVMVQRYHLLWDLSRSVDPAHSKKKTEFQVTLAGKQFVDAPAYI